MLSIFNESFNYKLLTLHTFIMCLAECNYINERSIILL